MQLYDKLTKIAEEILEESYEASIHFPRFNSYHEGYAVILEELDELWIEIKRKEHNKAQIRREAIQTGAMILRFVYDLVRDKYP